jgi:hypothetical protein
MRRGRVTGELGHVLDGLAAQASSELQALRASVP